MRRILLLSSALTLITLSAWTQLITTDPVFPTATKSAIVYFDATEGNQGLIDFTGDVYAHTGVITDKSTSGTDWKYVKTNWGENTPETKLERISDNYYSLSISPSIREYYGVPETDTIKQMAFVFRSSDNSRTGRDVGGTDIFVEVYEEGFNVSIIMPDKKSIAGINTDILFEASATESSLLTLYQNDVEIKSLTGSTITHTFNFAGSGDYWFKVVATLGDETSSDSAYVHVMDAGVEAPLPEGLQDGINYVDNQTVQLVLYAPGKESVFVIGDFNNWLPTTIGRMKQDGDRFWITLENLVPGEEYAYQYMVDGNIIIADPYTEKVLDPWNDPWISEETYPNLKPYPSGYTTGIVSILETGQQSYEWKNGSFSSPDQKNLVIYELLLRDFLAAHDWKTLTDTLDYLSNLGINVIELMPVNEFEGNESWGYNPSFYFAPDKFYGPADDLKAFIDSCHGRDIAVVLDMVLNHSYGQSPLVQLYYDPSTYKVTPDNPWYNVESPNPTYSWGYDFNHESQATKDFVDRVNRHWLTKYSVDGFRFDFTKGFTNTPGEGWSYDASRIAILERMADIIWQVNSNAYVILEHFCANTEEKELSNYGMMIWGNSNYNYRNAVAGYNDNGNSDFNWISYLSRGWNDPHVVGYMESHDEERLMVDALSRGRSSGDYRIRDLYTALERSELAGTFFFTIPGPKMVWQFGELGYNYSIEYGCRVCNKPIRWDYFEVGRRKKLYQVWSALINLKIQESAFETTDFSLSVADAAKRIELNHADMDVRIIGNFDVIPLDIDPNFSKSGWWYDFFGLDSIDVTDPNALITLAPGEYRIYTTRRLKDPGITAGINRNILSYHDWSVYPNPVRDLLYFEGIPEPATLLISDLSGKIVRQYELEPFEENIDLSGLKAGIYVISRHTEFEEPQYVKVSKQ